MLTPERKIRIAVFVSGGGTNLQALMDAQKSGIIKSGEIVHVVSDTADAYALERAQNNGIDTTVVDRKKYPDRESFEKKLIETIKSVDGVIEVNKLKTRLFASRMYVDVEFSADGDLSLTDAHEIAHRVHDLLEESFPEIKHCMVHVNPYGKM